MKYFTVTLSENEMKTLRVLLYDARMDDLIALRNINKDRQPGMHEDHSKRVVEYRQLGEKLMRVKPKEYNIENNPMKTSP